MLARLRRSFAAKLVALEVATILVVAVALAGLLVSARVIQTRELEQNVSGKAVDAFRRDLDTAGGGAASLSQRLADFGPLATEYPSADRCRLTALLSAEAATLPAGETLVAVDPPAAPSWRGREAYQAQGAVGDPALEPARRWSGWS